MVEWKIVWIEWRRHMVIRVWKGLRGSFRRRLLILERRQRTSVYKRRVHSSTLISPLRLTATVTIWVQMVIVVASQTSSAKTRYLSLYCTCHKDLNWTNCKRNMSHKHKTLANPSLSHHNNHSSKFKRNHPQEVKSKSRNHHQRFKRFRLRKIGKIKKMERRKIKKQL